MVKKYSPTQRCGLKAEKMACDFLQKQGLKKVTCNFRTRVGEIDLIMEDAMTLIFVEVRYRQQGRLGGGAESVTDKKQKSITRSAAVYLLKNPTLKSCRFDVVAIQGLTDKEEIRWIRGAFQVQ